MFYCIKVCSYCGKNSPLFRCQDCGLPNYMCSACDERIHYTQPLHNREMWCNAYGYFEPTSNRSNEGRLLLVICCLSWSSLIAERAFPIPVTLPKFCPLCGKEGTATLRPQSGTRIFVSLRGTYIRMYNCQKILPIQSNY